MTQTRSRWLVSPPPDGARSRELASQLEIPELLAALLVQRGFNSVEAARGFLRPSLEQLSDPLEFKDMDRAVSLIGESVRRGDTILVHGDYDVDGQCGTALLTRALRLGGADVVPFVPHRIRDGYDFGPAGLEAARSRGARLIITCDCGISAYEAVGRATEMGVGIVVTDHHLPPRLPPADAVINPRREDCPSPAKDLCGSGVAFKLVQALVPELSLPENLPYHFLDLVAMATVADIVPLTGENRVLTRFGLKLMSDSRWPGVRGLVEAAGLAGKPIRSGQVGFILAPRLNAVGRIADAMEGVNLLLEDDVGEARRIAARLEQLNTQRQAMDQEILVQAVEQVQQLDLDSVYGLVVAREDWHPGVIGIVASRLVERYTRPTVVIGFDGFVGRGSGRSVPGFDLYDALSKCRSLLVKFGGHKMAAGFSIEAENLSAFREAFNRAAHDQLTPDDLIPAQRVDFVVSLSQMKPDLEKLMRHLEPCGPGNPAPVFGVAAARAADSRQVGENHLKFVLRDAETALSAIGFNWSDRVDDEMLGGKVDVAFRLEWNEWGKQSALQARVLDIKPAA